MTSDQVVLDAMIAGHGRTALSIAEEIKAPTSEVVHVLNELRTVGRVTRTVNGRSVAYWSLP